MDNTSRYKLKILEIFQIYVYAPSSQQNPLFLFIITVIAIFHHCFILSTNHCRRYFLFPNRCRRCSSSTHCHRPCPRGSSVCRGYRSARGSTYERESRTVPDSGRPPEVTEASGQKPSSCCLDYNRIKKNNYQELKLAIDYQRD